MITPTPGRIVWYWPADTDPTPKFRGEALAAIVARVISDRQVNLTVFRADGLTYGRHGVQLLQDGDKRPEGGFCEWMPFQKGQAAKTEALEALEATARR
jgi:choline dehydrogenase-like flavoprotein